MIAEESEPLAKSYEKLNGLDGRSFDNRIGILRRTTTSKTNEKNRIITRVIIEEALAKSYEKLNGLDGRSFDTRLEQLSKTTTTTDLLNGIPFKITVLEEEALAKSYEKLNGLDGRSFDTRLGQLRKTTTSWAKVSEGLWDKTVLIEEALAKSYEKFNGMDGRSFDTRLDIFESNTTPDTSGPPTNIGGEVSENTLKEEQIKAEVFAAQLASDGRERQRTIAVPFATSISQLVSYGDLYNKFLTGRAFGWRFGGAITDTALTFEPFQTVTVADDTRLYVFKLDALQYAISQTEALCFWHGIEVGTALVSAPTDISKPLEITLGRFEAIGLTDAFILYNPIVLVEAIGLTDGFILYNPIVLSEAIGRSY